jgi:hypothetical protein
VPALFSSCCSWGVRRFAKHMSEILAVNRQLLVLNEQAGFDLNVNLAPALEVGCARTRMDAQTRPLAAPCC